MVIKRILVAILALLFLIQMPLFVNAEDQDVPSEYQDILDSIPDDVAELLPDGLFSSDMSEVEGAVGEMTSWDYIWETLLDLIGLNIGELIGIFATLTGLLLLCSLLSMLRSSIKNEQLSSIFPLITSIIVSAAILSVTREPLQRIDLFFEQMKTMINTMSPAICSLYAMGGNVSVAIVQNYGMIMFLSIFENVCVIALESILGICISLAVASAFMPNINLKPLSDAIKKVFTFFVGLAMLVFSTVISAQTVLASKADSLGTNTAKMFLRQFIPLVGGTVGDSLKTVGASIEYLRSTVGISIIVIFILLVLPTLITIAGTRLSFIASNAIAGLIGCEKEGKLLSEMASIYGYVLAIACICSIGFLFLITVFVRCTSALGG